MPRNLQLDETRRVGWWLCRVARCGCAELVRFGCGIRGLGGPSVWPMTSSATTKTARRAAREATIAAQEEIGRRTRANMDDLAVFFSARQRADAVDDWLTERVEALRVQAEARRADQRRQCGAALGAMRDRGESVRDIARMADISDKAVRELIRAAGHPAQDAIPAMPAHTKGCVEGNGQHVADGADTAVGPMAMRLGRGAKRCRESSAEVCRGCGWLRRRWGAPPPAARRRPACSGAAAAGVGSLRSGSRAIAGRFRRQRARMTCRRRWARRRPAALWRTGPGRAIPCSAPGRRGPATGRRAPRRWVR